MNGYRYIIERNRLLYKLEDDLARIKSRPQAERESEAARLRESFDLELEKLYAEVAAEYPGERRKKARPLTDPR